MPALSLSDDASRETLVGTISAKISQGAEITSKDLQALAQLHGTTALPLLDRSYLLRNNNNHVGVSNTTTLVRHLGMVQDMLDPEYYLAKVNGQSTHFRDVPISPDIPNDNELMSNLAERQPLMIVPIPFSTDWFVQEVMNNTRESSSSSSSASSPTTVATTLIPDDDSPMMTRKRDREMEDEHNMDSSATKQRTQTEDSMDCDDDHDDDHVHIHGGENLDWWPAGCMGSDEKQCPVLAKLYYDVSSSPEEQPRKLRLNDLVETIGVLSLDPLEADFGSDDCFGSVNPPPPSRLPRLHVLSYRIVDLDGLAAAATKTQSSASTTYESVMKDHDEQPSVTMSAHSSTNQKNNLIVDLMTNVWKDPVLAEALSMTLLSTAERRQVDASWEMQRAPQHALGCASLQIIVAPSHTTTTTSSQQLFQKLSTALKSICPVVATVDCNSSSSQVLSCPHKLNGRMKASPWQLPKGSVLLIHRNGGVAAAAQAETKELLEELVSQHRVPYTFDGGMRVPFDADYRIIVVSSGGNNSQTLPCTLQLTLQRGGTLEEMAATALSSSSTLRQSLLQSYNHGKSLSLDQQLLEKAQEDFLQRRGQARTGDAELPQEEDFHRWLTLTRLQARSQRQSCARIQDWERALVLDDAIKATTKGNK